MARDLFFTHYEPSSPPPSPPPSEPTNTLAITSVPKYFFEPYILNLLRAHFMSYGEINQWIPLPGFGRITIVYESEHHAEAVKLQCDLIVVEPTPEHPRITLRVFRADPNPLILRGERSCIPQSNYLQPPAIEKNFLISPPGSPPIGWEPVKEDPPSTSPLAEDLVQALRQLQTFSEQPAFDGSGVGVYVEDYDANHSRMDISEEDWVYGESAPAREKWRPYAASL